MTLAALLLLLAVLTPAVAGASDGVTVRRCVGSQPTGSSADELRKLAVEFVQSSNFNTAAHPRILKLSVATIQDHYRRVVAGDCLIVTYDRPCGSAPSAARCPSSRSSSASVVPITRTPCSRSMRAAASSSTGNTAD